ncbi:hypothetical protein PpBr36_00796 [Pyricularia pennisetigena]|uniref:hypothetical protein n=1 Tax=Pyricularia pennisetigena TaxID=1578925 RepID=UPI0011515D90|nr:hypothetical protein PpBr36_00796 [Pyricularia pennisetigena]TLS29329.1 hypothetical protein PpBr36_00796 [Pyricularia pennisetigena]
MCLQIQRDATRIACCNNLLSSDTEASFFLPETNPGGGGPMGGRFSTDLAVGSLITTCVKAAIA